MILMNPMLSFECIIISRFKNTEILPATGLVDYLPFKIKRIVTAIMRIKTISGTFSFFFCCLAEVASQAAMDFFGQQFTMDAWRQHKKVFSCWQTKGLWAASAVHHHMYSSTCISSQFTDIGICALTNRTKYHWEVAVDTCGARYRHWSYEDMCSLLAGRSIMFVGDSVMEEMYFTFMSAMRVDSCGPSYQRQITCRAGGSFGISNVRNDRLSVNPNDAVDSQNELMWASRLASENVSLLVLNRGAQYVEDGLLLAELKATLAYLEQNFPKISVIYRNTPMGHINNAESFFAKPLLESDSVLRSNRDLYHFSDFPRQNALVEAMLAESFPRVLHWDVFTSTVLRADSHCDSLQYCIPGPIDNWVRMLFNILHTLSGQETPPEDAADEQPVATSAGATTSTASALIMPSATSIIPVQTTTVDSISETPVAVAANQSQVDFFGQRFSADAWQQHKNTFNCWQTRGSWAKSAPHHHMYSSTCISMMFTDEGMCAWANRTQFHWEVEKATCGARYRHWSYEEMCGLLAGRSIMFVGDSITQEMYFTFMSAMRVEGCAPSYQKRVSCTPGGQGEGAGGPTFGISNVRNDRLSLTAEAVLDAEHEQMWVSRLAEENVSLLVLNRGAHYVEDTVLLNELNETLSYLEAHFPAISVIYRNTPLGHMDNINSFLAEPLLVPDSVLRPNPDFFHYTDFPRQNALVEAMLAESFPRVLHWDVFTSTVLRADSHCDPLHYCIPGPIDNWVRMLFNMLHSLSGQSTPLSDGPDESSASSLSEEKTIPTAAVETTIAMTAATSTAAAAALAATKPTSDTLAASTPPLKTTEVDFLGQRFSADAWQQHKNTFNCWQTKGSWAKSAPHRHMYSSTCISMMFTDEGMCAWANRTQFHWEVEKATCGARYRHWSYEEMCGLLAGRSIMFVGDSITEEFYFTFMSAMRVEDCAPSPQRVISCAPGGGSGDRGEIRISCSRNDRLSLAEDPALDPLDQVMWASRVGFENVSLLVLNRGAHYVEDAVLLAELNETLSYLQTYFPQVSVIFRNTPLGHIDPVNSFLAEPLLVPDSVLRPSPDFFHYSDFPRQNALVEAMLAERFPRVLHWDVFTSTVLRADSHCDPLHYCIPGPIDNWVRMLFNMLHTLSGQVTPLSDESDESSASSLSEEKVAVVAASTPAASTILAAAAAALAAPAAPAPSGSAPAALVQITEADFFGRHFSADAWQQHKNAFNCWQTKGSWAKSAPENQDSMFKAACLSMRYTDEGMCGWPNRTKYDWEVGPGGALGAEALGESLACGAKYRPWSFNEMCGLLAGRSIMFVGDSITEEMYFTFMSAMRVESCPPAGQRAISCSSSSGVGGAGTAGGGGNPAGEFRISNVRNDRLSLTAEAVLDAEHEQMWVSRLVEENVSLLVLNRGAHYVEDAVLLAELTTTLSYLEAHFPAISVIYRNTPLGHIDPVNTFLAEPLLVPDSVLRPNPDFFHYSDFPRQNALVEAMLAERFPRVLHWDVFTSTALRADSHCDPLHYCIPGPIDNWVRMLFNMLYAVSHGPTKES